MNDFDNKPDDRDDLWELLGKARDAKNAGSPLFSRNVLREIRLSKDQAKDQGSQPGVFSWLLRRWHLASVCTLAVVLLSVNASRMFVQHKPVAPVVPVAVAPAPDTNKSDNKTDDPEVIAHLDELAANEENSIWLEDSSE
ncbi:MAG TPA: hypothetical protein VG733_12955 [Chthoniobacteraceae bacterium]|nr:hypothetical protein [Chthoniobacteraceae bacterium]